MNRWLYRAVGTVGIAGGALVFGAGAAQADQTDLADQALADVFSPTSGLLPLDLTDPDRPAPGTEGAGELQLDPADGRVGHAAPAARLGGAPEPEVLPGLPGLPLGLDSLLGGLPLGGLPLDGLPLDGLPVPVDGLPTNGLPTDGLPVDGLPLDAVGVPDGSVGAGVPLGSLPLDGVGAPDGSLAAGVPLDGVATLDGQAIGLPTDAAGALPTAPETATGQRPAELVGPMPFLAQPLSDALLAGRSLGDLVTVGELTSQVPVAGPMVGQTAGNLPLVSDVVPAQQPNQSDPRTLPADPATPGLDPAGREQLRPVIADQLAAEGGFSPELLGAGSGGAEITGAVPLLGPALEPVGKMVGVGNLADQLPLVGPIAGSTLGGLPVVEPPAVPGIDPAGGGSNPDPARASGERPVTGEDPEFAPPGRPVESLPAPVDSLPVGAGEFLPVSGLTQQLPVPLPLEALRSLPVLGQITGGLPV